MYVFFLKLDFHTAVSFIYDSNTFFVCSVLGVSSTTNNVPGIDGMCPSTKEDFNEFEKLLKEKICQFEKSVHYSSFMESLVRELCISCEQQLFFLAS